MTARAIALAALVAAGCSSPAYHSGGFACAADKRCPSGFTCAADNRCWAAGTGPDLSHATMAMMDLATANDLAGRDTGPGGDMVTNECAGAVVCDGFEAASIDSIWRVSMQGGSATLDTTMAHKGTHAIHIHTDPDPAVDMGRNPSAAIMLTSKLPVSGGVLWARAWVYIQAPYPTSFTQLMNFLDAGTTGVSLAMSSGSAVLNDYTGPNMAFNPSSTSVPSNQWTCLKMSATQPGPTGDIHIFIGDTEASDAKAIGASVNAITQIGFGTDFYNNPAIGASDLWIDDIIVDDKPISCSD